MKIAVCGDDRNTREQIASLIREQEPDAEIVTFEARETMIKSQENFAVSFLDVEMKEISGLDVVNGTTILIYDTVPATLFLDSGDTYNVVRDSHSQCHAFSECGAVS